MALTTQGEDQLPKSQIDTEATTPTAETTHLCLGIVRR
jgi:hypothetical protein